MINIITSPNSVYISRIQTGCLKEEFDLTYPVHLNGIINQDEYQTSINRINRTVNSANKNLTILIIVSTLIMIGGITLCAVSPATAGPNKNLSVIFAVLSVGLVGTTLGLILFCISIRIAYRHVAHLRQAIAEESMKYSSRSPISCSWRLETGVSGGYGGSVLINRIVIDIANSTIPGYTNQSVVGPRVFFGQQNAHEPPPYSDDQSTRFCSQCGTSRHNMTAKNCSSCGQSFNKI